VSDSAEALNTIADIVEKFPMGANYAEMIRFHTEELKSELKKEEEISEELRLKCAEFESQVTKAYEVGQEERTALKAENVDLSNRSDLQSKLILAKNDEVNRLKAEVEELEEYKIAIKFIAGKYTGADISEILFDLHTQIAEFSTDNDKLKAEVEKLKKSWEPIENLPTESVDVLLKLRDGEVIATNSFRGYCKYAEYFMVIPPYRR